MEQNILELLQGILPQVDFTSSEDLVSSGILDSISMVEVVSELSIEYGIKVPYDEIVPDNFNSLDAIVRLVERLRK